MATSTAYSRLVKGRCGKNAKVLAKKYKDNGLKNGKTASELDKTIKKVLDMPCTLSGTKRKKRATTTKRKATTKKK